MLLFSVSQPIVDFSCCFDILILKLEKKLKLEIEAWESKQGREFFVNGQKFLQYVEEQWELFRIEKEKEKQERVRPPPLFWLVSAGTRLQSFTFIFSPISI